MRLAFALGLLVLLAACSPDAPGSLPALNGREGVVVTPVDTVSEVYEGEDFPVSFEIENRGLTGVAPWSPGAVYWSFDSLYLTQLRVLSSSPDGTFDLLPRSRYAGGEKTFVTGYFRANDLQRSSVRADTTVRLSVCYPYESNVTAQVCLEQIRSPDSGAIACRSTPIRPDSPGAPIGVRLIETRTRHIDLPNGSFGVVPQFRITLENYGDGIPSVSRELGVRACEDDRAVLQAVDLRAFLLNQPLDCDADDLADSGFVNVAFSRLAGRSEAFIACSLPEDAALFRGQGNFLSLLTVQLRYHYRDGEQVEVVVLSD